MSDIEKYVIYVGNMSYDTNERTLHKLFSSYGTVLDVDIPQDRDRRRPKGFAFVEVKDLDSQDRIIDKFNESDIDGRTVRLQVAESAGKRGGGGGRDRMNGGDRGGGSSNPRILVENLPPGTSWRDLKDFMRDFGEIQFTDVNDNGDGVCEFRSSRDLESALNQVDGCDYKGSKIAAREVSEGDLREMGFRVQRGGGGGGRGGGRGGGGGGFRDRGPSRYGGGGGGGSRGGGGGYRDRNGGGGYGGGGGGGDSYGDRYNSRDSRGGGDRGGDRRGGGGSSGSGGGGFRRHSQY